MNITDQTDSIIAKAAEVFRVTPQEILGPSRRQPVFHARMAAVHVLHEGYLLNQFNLAAKFGRCKNWATWAVKTGVPSCRTDKKFKERLAEVVRGCQS